MHENLTKWQILKMKKKKKNCLYESIEKKESDFERQSSFFHLQLINNIGNFIIYNNLKVKRNEKEKKILF